MSVLDSILQQYEENKKAKKPKLSSEERLKKYFTHKLQKGKKSGEKVFRIIPPSDGSGSPFEMVHFHKVEVYNTFSQQKQLRFVPCSKHNDGKRCPLCEAKEALYATGKAEDKTLAKTYNTRKFYIAKGIDRDNEDHGVKFWRIAHNFRGEGVMDKMIPLFREYGDMTDIENGSDLKMVMSRNNEGHNVLSAILPKKTSILSDDKELMEEWLKNDETWRDVYSNPSEEWMEIVARQLTPVWDKELGKYIIWEEYNSAAESEEESTISEDLPKVPEVEGDDDDDLPF